MEKFGISSKNFRILLLKGGASQALELFTVWTFRFQARGIIPSFVIGEWRVATTQVLLFDYATVELSNSRLRQRHYHVRDFHSWETTTLRANFCNSPFNSFLVKIAETILKHVFIEALSRMSQRDVESNQRMHRGNFCANWKARAVTKTPLAPCPTAQLHIWRCWSRCPALRKSRAIL